MEVRVIRGEDAFNVLAPEWDALHDCSATATPFNSVPFARVWWRHWGTPGALRLWTVREEGRLIGLAPLYESTEGDGRPVMRLVGGTEVSDYLDILAVEGQEERVVNALLDAWVRSACDCPIVLHALPHASPTREAFLRGSTERGFVAREEPEEVCPVISLPDSWERYLGSLDRKLRHELRRKMRKAGQAALVSWYHAGGAVLEEEMEHFFRLHALSDPAKARFMTAEMRAFFLELALTCAERGWLDLSFLLVDGERAATTLSFLFRNQVYLYNSGFDPDVGENLSPGWLLLCYQIEESIQEGKRRFDFLRGNEEYKYRFGARSEPVYRMRLERTRP